MPRGTPIEVIVNYSGLQECGVWASELNPRGFELGVLVEGVE